MRKWIILIGIVIIALLGYQYLYHDHRDIANEDASYTVAAIAFSEEFQINSSASEVKYLDNIIQVTGTVSHADKKTLTLNSTVFCQLSNPTATNPIKKGDNVNVKGRFIGYDELLEEIKLDQCQIIN